MQIITNWFSAASHATSAQGITHLPSAFWCACFPEICLRKTVWVPLNFLSITSKSTQIPEPKSSTACPTVLYNISATLESAPFLINSFLVLPQTVLACLMFFLINGQSYFVWSRGHPICLKFATTSISVYPCHIYRLKSISPYLSAISTSLCLSRISLVLLHLSVHLCLRSLAAGIFIPQRSHLCSGSGPSCSIATSNFQCRYMNCSLRLPGLFSLSGNPSTGHITDFSTCGKDTLYVSSAPTLTSTPLCCGRNIPCVLYMWWWREDSAIALPYSSQLILVLLFYPKVSPSPIALLLYENVSCWPQINPRVHTIALVLPRFVWRSTLLNILTISVRVVCTNFAPLSSRCLHRKQCSSHLMPIKIRGVTHEVRRLPVGPPLPLRPPRC